MTDDTLDRSTGISNPMVLINAAIEKGIDPDKLGRLVDLAERWEKNQAAKDFGYAIQEFQRRMPPVVKTSPVKNRAGELMYHFADYDDVLEIANPIMAELGIVPTFSMKFENGMMLTTCRIRVGTHCEETTVPLGIPAIPNANDSQRAGGALSYGKRYALCAALNIRIKGEDRDGNGLHETLNDKQTEELNNLFEKCRNAGREVNKAEFFKYMGCVDLNDLPAKEFERAKWALNQKLSKK